MTDTYPTQATADADRARLLPLWTTLNAAKSSFRLDDCRMWVIRGRGQNYASTWGNSGDWLLFVQCRSATAWTWAKKRLAPVAKVTQDGDDEGVLRLHTLPTPEQAAHIRDILGIRQTREGDPSAFNLRVPCG